MAVVVRRAALRLLLVVVASLGVVGMHTLGHVDTAHGASAGMGCGSCHHDAMAAAPSVLADVVAHGLGAGMDPSEVCLAILTAVGLVALLGLVLVAWRTATGEVVDLRAVLAVAVRGPPPRPRLGLNLADLSVLRR